MNDKVEKYRLKYLKATNSLLIVAIFVVVRSIFYYFNNETMIYLLEINRLINQIGGIISDSSVVLGILVDLSINVIISIMIFFIWKETQKGRIKIFISFVVFYFLDMFLYFYSYDVVSFLIHFVFLAYMLFGIIFYKKMYVEFLISKNKKEEE